MVQRKTKIAPVERRLTNKQLDAELAKVKFRSKKNQAIFDDIKNQTWFRQYARGSDVAKEKIIKKVRRGINHGKYTYMGNKDEIESQGKEDLTQQQKNIAKKQNAIVRKATGTNKTYKKKVYRAPSGKTYTKNPVAITKKEYTKQVKESATEFRMVDI